MVDEIVNKVVDSGKPESVAADLTAGYELPLLLLAGFRSVVEELHSRLAGEGYADLRPAHGFLMQAVGARGATATDIGRRMGVSKQAAGKSVDRMVALGYLVRAEDPGDGRRKLVRLTARGEQALRRSAAIFHDLRTEWTATLGVERVRALESDLRTMSPSRTFSLDVAGWLSV